jgi:Zn-dependent protease
MWGVMSWVAGQRRPDRSVWQKVFVGLLTMPIAVGSEWCHNIAHAAAAWWVGKPMDAMRIAWGTPLVVYFDIEDPSVTPREHIIRALGGPLFNALALLPILIGRGLTRTTTLARELLDIALASNLFLLLVGMLPIPGIDGGPILKWSLVSRGRTPREADRVVRQVDGVLAVGLGAAASLAFKKKKHLVGSLLALLAVMSMVLSFGWIKEQDLG